MSLCGAEFGADKADFSNEDLGVFGRDYTYNSERTAAYFCDNDLRLLRLPFRWERLQPRLGEALDETELNAVFHEGIVVTRQSLACGISATVRVPV